MDTHLARLAASLGAVPCNNAALPGDGLLDAVHDALRESGWSQGKSGRQDGSPLMPVLPAGTGQRMTREIEDGLQFGLQRERQEVAQVLACQQQRDGLRCVQPGQDFTGVVPGP